MMAQVGFGVGPWRLLRASTRSPCLRKSLKQVTGPVRNAASVAEAGKPNDHSKNVQSKVGNMLAKVSGETTLFREHVRKSVQQVGVQNAKSDELIEVIVENFNDRLEGLLASGWRERDALETRHPTNHPAIHSIETVVQTGLEIIGCTSFTVAGRGQFGDRGICAELPDGAEIQAWISAGRDQPSVIWVLPSISPLNALVNSEDLLLASTSLRYLLRHGTGKQENFFIHDFAGQPSVGYRFGPFHTSITSSPDALSAHLRSVLTVVQQQAKITLLEVQLGMQASASQEFDAFAASAKISPAKMSATPGLTPAQVPPASCVSPTAREPALSTKGAGGPDDRGAAVTSDSKSRSIDQGTIFRHDAPRADGENKRSAENATNGSKGGLNGISEANTDAKISAEVAKPSSEASGAPKTSPDIAETVTSGTSSAKVVEEASPKFEETANSETSSSKVIEEASSEARSKADKWFNLASECYLRPHASCIFDESEPMMPFNISVQDSTRKVGMEFIRRTGMSFTHFMENVNVYKAACKAKGYILEVEGHHKGHQRLTFTEDQQSSKK